MKRISFTPKNSKNKKTDKQSITRKRLWIIAGAALFAVLVLQTVVILQLYQRQRYGDPGTWPIKSLIITAVDNLGRPGVRDGLSGKTYIPEQKLVLPYVADAPLIKYTVGDNTSFQIANQQALNQMSSKLLGTGLNGPTSKALHEAFEVVPGLQACSRQVTIGFGDTADTDGTLVLTKKLADGRTAHIYRDTGCNAVNGDEFVEYIRQIDSYTPNS